MKKIKNEFIQHLLNFGEMVKANGRLTEESDYQKAYIYETEPYDYCFKTMKTNGTEVHSILIFKNLDKKDGEEFFCPLFCLWFTNDGKMFLQDSDDVTDWARQNQCSEFRVTDERYYGEL